MSWCPRRKRLLHQRAETTGEIYRLVQVQSDSAKIQRGQIEPIKFGAAQICARQSGSIQVRAAEVRFAQVSISQVGGEQVRLTEADLAQIQSVQIARPQIDQR